MSCEYSKLKMNSIYCWIDFFGFAFGVDSYNWTDLALIFAYSEQDWEKVDNIESLRNQATLIILSKKMLVSLTLFGTYGTITLISVDQANRKRNSNWNCGANYVSFYAEFNILLPYPFTFVICPSQELVRIFVFTYIQKSKVEE